MRRLTLTSAATLLAFLLLVPPAWAEWTWPVRGEVITPYRNGTDPYASGQHRGIDIAASTGTPVIAAAGGEVRFAGTAGSSGLTVSVRTADGRYDTSYLHLSSTSVREGDSVAAGQRLGAVGTTGSRSATAPHLHFGVRDAGSRHAYHDPLGFLPPPTATEPPRSAPAPEPNPAPVEPVPAPTPTPGREPVGAPRRVPVGAPRRVPVGAPRRVPVGAAPRVPVGAPGQVPATDPRRVPAGEPGRVPATDPRRVPVGEPRRVPVGTPRGVPASEPHRVPAGEPGGAPTTAARFAPAGTPQHDPVDAARRASLRAPTPGEAAAPSRSAAPPEAGSSRVPQPSGPDFGLLAACLGLLAAAALVGLTGDRREATRRTTRRITRVLQPMLGRR
jgi:hypothetical protein